MMPPTDGWRRRSRSSAVSSVPAMSSITGPRGSGVIGCEAIEVGPEGVFRGASVEGHRGFANQRLHLPHGLAQAYKQRAADDGVADMQLAHAGKRGDRLHVEIVERVPGVEAHAERAHGRAGVADLVELGDHRGTLAIAALGVKRMRIGTGMDLADLDADTRRGIDLLGQCIDE